MIQSMLKIVPIGQPIMMERDAPNTKVLCQNTAKNLAMRLVVQRVSFFCCLMVKSKTILTQ